MSDIAENAAWDAVLRRDRAFDVRFVTGVLTTGIYCRPSCAARHPARGNVRFFADGAAARAAGLRPCKRCLPDDVARDEAAVLAAIDEIRSAEGTPSLSALALLTGYSPAHFQRVFKRAIGLSPAAYAWALRETRARDALSDSESVTGAIYEAGCPASRSLRKYQRTTRHDGKRMGEWGVGVSIRWAVVETTGKMLVAATDKGVCRCPSMKTRARCAFASTRRSGRGRGGLRKAARRGRRQCRRPGSGAHIPLDVKGTAFQEACWEALRAIPPGETRTYAEIAAAAGNPKAVAPRAAPMRVTMWPC